MGYKNIFEVNETLGVCLLAFPEFRTKEVYISNPLVDRSYDKAYRMEAIIGLTTGVGEPVEKFEPDDVRRMVMEMFPSGGTIIMQLGWWAGKPEDSVRLTIFNMLADSTSLPEKDFEALMKEIIGMLTVKMRQYLVPVEFWRGSTYIKSYGLGYDA